MFGPDGAVFIFYIFKKQTEHASIAPEGQNKNTFKHFLASQPSF
jgi:hypothetical protein